MIRELTYPFTAAKVRELDVGDRLVLAGPMVTARCRVYKHLLDNGGCPVDLDNGAVFHCSPIIVRAGSEWEIRAAGPSGSTGVDMYVPRFLDRYRVRVMVGLGALEEQSRKACMRHGCVYAQAVGGAGSLLARSIREVTGVHFYKEFGAADAMWELVADGLEAVVSIDTRGRSLHRRVKASSKRALRELMG